MKVRELLSSEDKWCKEAYARDKDGCSVDIESEDAVKFCLVGALQRCYNDYSTYGGGCAAIVKSHLSPKSGKPIHWLSFWNDAPERTFADVKQLVEELDI